MSTELQWTRKSNYCLQAPPDWSICGIGGASGWSYECWKGGQQLNVGMPNADAAKAWCQRHHEARSVTCA